MARVATVLVLCALGREATADPALRASTEIGLAQTDLEQGDSVTTSETGFAARAAATVEAAEHVEVGLRLGLAYMSTDEAATRRYANPVLDLALVRDVSRFRLRGGWSMALPLADTRTVFGSSLRQDAATLAAAAHVWGPWDVWQWTVGWATVVAPLAARYQAADAVSLTAELTTGLSFATGERPVNDDVSIWITQAALGGEVALGAGAWVGGRILDVAVVAQEQDATVSSTPYGYADQNDTALELAGGVRFSSIAVSALVELPFGDLDSTGVSLGVETWR
jgi:hypothetical protein